MSQQWKIYTKTGDKGETSLIGGKRVPKFDQRIEAYGTVDELKSYIGLIRDQDISTAYKNLLIEIQDRLFTIESSLATDLENPPERKLPSIQESDIKLLEDEIDAMNEKIPSLNSFILPGGNLVSSHCQVARTICRRAERLTIKLASGTEIQEINIKYLNRLSDYLFVLARKCIYDFGGEETKWKARI
ncbi:MAG: cob(I)yrinic acid a,c-diamide adenosyltransferase [Bacteroidetes bacterium]|nr:cob(I)yrinic acid a,c-diamide adenosyltransferase [Bacteroidota bacterium]